ncbi:hypothetical protein VC279_06240 [Xanthomonas sp. WHRI 10064A]|uniref:hypothetical protein n=1 Tax=unclassified Xanthomonas TaxID=2643310 RepID=UPI002B233EF6|nr:MULTISPECIES: hypothetical protein [unclassified Xanthomonas]MEA9585911.1 hypothetical protein [Xanthomonas sp. WHRI 10064B]MEA9614338.1 hypothetical protein [Xanthomonas sp. WHRI 10064A]
MRVSVLPAEVYNQMVVNGKVYRDAKASGDYKSAESKLLATWDAFPEPKHLWDSSESTIKVIIDFYIERQDFTSAEKWAKELFKCDPLPNDPEPYIILGKIYLESGRQDLATHNLVKAYEVGGRRGYVGEDQKYLKYALDQMKKAGK